jgi:hypothetical protein
MPAVFVLVHEIWSLFLRIFWAIILRLMHFWAEECRASYVRDFNEVFRYLLR